MFMHGLKLYQGLKNAKDQDQKDQLIAQAIDEVQTDSATASILTELKTDVGELKTDVSKLKSDVAELKMDMNGLRKNVHQIPIDIKDLEIRLTREMNAQTWKFLGGLALIAVVFKIAEMIFQKLV